MPRVLFTRLVFMSDVLQSIADMEWMRKSHVDWAEYFEKHPDIEKEYVATGEWSSAAQHRDIIAKYDNVIQLLKTLLSNNNGK